MERKERWREIVGNNVHDVRTKYLLNNSFHLTTGKDCPVAQMDHVGQAPVVVEMAIPTITEESGTK